MDSITYNGHHNGNLFIVSGFGDDMISINDVNHVFVLAAFGNIDLTTDVTNRRFIGVSVPIITATISSYTGIIALPDNDNIVISNSDSGDKRPMASSCIIIGGPGSDQLSCVNSIRTVVIGDGGRVRITFIDENEPNRDWPQLPIDVSWTVYANTNDHLHSEVNNGLTLLLAGGGDSFSSKSRHGETIAIANSGNGMFFLCKSFLVGYLLTTVVMFS
jgi:hypothetical protein